MYEIDKYNVKDEDKIVKLVMKDFHKSNDWREPIAKQNKDYLSYYYGKHLPNDNINRAGKNQIFVNYTFGTIQTILPRLMGSQFKANTMVTVKPREIFDTELKEIMETLIKYEFDNIPNLFVKTLYAFLQSCQFGDGFVNVFWDTVRNAIGYDFVDWGDLYPDPLGTDFFNSRYVVHRIETVFKHLKDMERTKKNPRGKYFNIDKVKNTQYPTDFETFAQYRDDILGREYNRETDEKIEILQLQTPEWIIAIANREVLIRHERNAYEEITFMQIPDYPDPTSFHNIGEIQIIFQQQKEANLRCNQDLDNYDLQLQPIYALRAGSVSTNDILKMYDRKVINIAGTEDINKLLTRWAPDVQPGLGEQSVRTLRENMEFANGITSAVRGQESQRNDTATGWSIQAEAALQRIELKIDCINYQFAAPFGRKILKYYHLFLEEDKVIRITNKSDITPFKQFKVPRDRLQFWETFDIVPVTTKEQVDKRAHQERMTLLGQYIQGLVDDEIVMSKLANENFGLNIAPVIKKVLRAHEVMEVDDILVVRQDTTVDNQGGSIPGGNQPDLSTEIPAENTLTEGASGVPEFPVLNKQKLAQEMMRG